MPQFDSGAAEPIGRFSEGLLLRLLQEIRQLLAAIASRCFIVRVFHRTNQELDRLRCSK